MNGYVKTLFFLSALATCMFICCTATPESSDARNIAIADNNDRIGAVTPEFSDIRDKNWNLMELRLKSENITINRDKMAEISFGDIFTLRFDAERIGGTGAPNHFIGPYTLADKQAITIGNLAATLMAPIFEPEGLKEYDYFSYLQNTSKWNIVKGNLELYTKDNAGAEVVLVFAAAVE
jgi:heat shock protein HslJ